MATPLQVGAPFTGEQAALLLDFSRKLDITLLDSVVGCFYGSVGPQVSYITLVALLASMAVLT